MGDIESMAEMRERRRACRWQGIFVLVVLFLTGCAESGDYARGVKDYSASLAAGVDAATQQKGVAGGENSPEPLSFAEACYQAALNDKEMADVVTELGKSDIDFAGTRSSLLPRLNVAANAEVPLQNQDDAESDLTGGVFVEYDIWRALAVGDETVLRRAMTEKHLYQLRLQAQRLQLKLLQLLRRTDFLQYSRDKKEQALALAESGYSLAKIYVEQQQRPPAALIEWRSRRDGLQAELEGLRAEQQEAAHQLNQLLGVAAAQSVRVSDGGEVLQGQAEISPSALSAAGVWSRHDEARLYELELIAAEAAVTLVQMDRLPKVNFNLGLGKIPLQGNGEETASTLMRFSVAMPLWDMGDYQRKYAKSRITRDRIKAAMANKVKHLANRARLAEDGCEMARSRVARLEKAITESRWRIEAQGLLAAEGRGDGLVAVQQKIELLEMQQRHAEAEADLGAAMDNLRLAAGLEPVSGTVDPLVARLADGAGGEEQHSGY